MESLAWAQATTPTVPAPSPLGMLLPFILILFVFYFLVLLPQQRKQKEHKKMLDELKVGDKIVTVGGVVGQVEKIKDNIVTVKVGEGVSIDFLRNAISQVVKPQNSGK
ncbi:MAG TPA: preprotein translocase subunit YajC [bacterium]|nr:preprotein translocase subunit YajC [bacterium]HOL66047.1 preprotein translocase subunit YajC [bacterium]